ncbi:11_t:CDS:2 [Funneliformis geosporum]|uniref:Holocytochrome c-type synthase n=1 Tax=Funneliformis geosporum TaxID=1117311 RepID=A0A9W4WNT3_9GLOM|nr:11_t:CDS:2 [Funneliformis geosporum]
MSTSNIPSGCPMHEKIAQSFQSETSSHNDTSKETSCGGSLSPDNLMPQLSQEPVSGQQIHLPTNRIVSSIPKAKGSEYWEYPSPQQFYSALVRKGWETPEESIEMMVSIHNFLNDRAWNEILKWENMKKCNCDGPKLLRFKGRPQEPSPKARMLQWASKLFPSIGTPPPFDRHDWTIDRCGREVRYVIDYYSAPDEGDNPVFFLDVRPALDSIDSVVDRIKVATKETFAQLRERAKAARQGTGDDRCYGISQDPTTKNFIIVLYHAHHGSLKTYLGQHYGELDWTYKLGILNQVAEGLKKIHQAGFVHRDFHSGNILLSNYAEIADLGFTGPVSKKVISTSTTSKHVVYGVLPYISPEVLRGIKYDYAADVYSFGIVMWEIATCLPPFNDRAHDTYLALDICLGLRPNVEDYIPEPFAKLMTRCWDAKPSARPCVHEIYQILHKWYWNLKDGDDNVVTKSFINADSIDLQSSTPASSRPVTQTHPLAVYTSRLLNFHDLPEPINALQTSGRRIQITNSLGIISNDSLEEYRTRQLDDELSFVTFVPEQEEKYVSRQVDAVLPWDDK